MEEHIHIGKAPDSLEEIEELERLCNAKAAEIAETITESGTVSFWTTGMPELIGIAEFKKGSDGKVTYKFDPSLSTL